MVLAARTFKLNNHYAVRVEFCMFELKSGFDPQLFLPQIPEEEKNLGPQDRLIHVYHFTKDASQNQMVNKL